MGSCISRANGDLADLPPRYGYEDPLEVLRKYNIVFLLDDSGSMIGSRWREASRALAAVAERAARYDPDGIDIHFLNSKETGRELKQSDAVTRLLGQVKPYGPTPTGGRLGELLRSYISEIEDAKFNGGKKMPKPVNFIVITDGVPTDDPQSVIVAAAERLDRGNFLLSQVGIQFIQIGKDRKATKALRAMDNELIKSRRIRDIVDTTPYRGKPLDGATVMKVLLGGINRRVDNQGGAAVMDNN